MIDRRRGIYRTPDWLYRPLRRLMPFALDVAASAENAKCRRFYTQHDEIGRAHV